jgi:hypothetical protein
VTTITHGGGRASIVKNEVGDDLSSQETPGSFCGGRINQMRGPLLMVDWKWLADGQTDAIDWPPPTPVLLMPVLAPINVPV